MADQQWIMYPIEVDGMTVYRSGQRIDEVFPVSFDYIEFEQNLKNNLLRDETTN